MPNQLPSALKDFYLNEVMRNEVRDYFTHFLKDEVVRLAFSEKEVSGAVLAKNSIDSAFENLEILFASQSEGKVIKQESR